MPNRQLVLSVDVGTTKVAALIGAVSFADEVSVLGISATPVLGLRRGQVVDAEHAALALRDAVNRANSMAETRLYRAVFSVNGSSLSLISGQAEIPLTSGVVREQDIRRAVKLAKRRMIVDDRPIIHLMQRTLWIDGRRYGTMTSGQSGKHLRVEVQAVQVPGNFLRNLRQLAGLAGLTAIEFIPAPLASADAVLLPEEKYAGVLHLNIGGETTSWAVYDRNMLVNLGVIPLGGDAVTTSLSEELGIVSTQAERLKWTYGLAEEDSEQMIRLRVVSGRAVKTISVQDIEHIARACVKSWTTSIEQHLAPLFQKEPAIRRVVLTGGGALLKGIDRYVAHRWQATVRIGSVQGLRGLSDLSRNPGYATVVGAARNWIAQENTLPVPGMKQKILHFWHNFG
ncbi:MAG: cell division protein FtsA [Firmicutes bacterium]|nr:cell division protein FtsA [Bacillota bacterium]